MQKIIIIIIIIELINKFVFIKNQLKKTDIKKWSKIYLLLYLKKISLH